MPCPKPQTSNSSAGRHLGDPWSETLLLQTRKRTPKVTPSWEVGGAGGEVPDPAGWGGSWAAGAGENQALLSVGRGSRDHWPSPGPTLSLLLG